MNVEPTAIARALLFREALHLDRQEWAAWLELYHADCEYWVPAWKSESVLVSDVRREISFIYHASRAGLEERVVRIRSRKSVTAMPLPRTAHVVSNVLADEPAGGDGSSAAADVVAGTATFVVHEFDPRTAKQHTHFGRYEFVLEQRDAAWKIARKKIVLMNDVIPTAIDFYNL